MSRKHIKREKGKYWVQRRTKKYDINLLKENLKNIKGTPLKDLTVGLDMDNTTFVYSTESNDKASLMIQNENNFFANLPIMDEFVDDFISAMKSLGAKVIFITSANELEEVHNGKLESIRKNGLDVPEEDVVFVPMGKNKAQHLTELGLDISKSILIDDYYQNLMDWYEAGGIGIKKTYSGKKRPIPQIQTFEEGVDLIQRILN